MAYFMKQILIAVLLVFAIFANFRTAGPESDDELLIFTKFVNEGDKKVSESTLRLYLYNSDFVLSRTFDLLKNSDAKFITSYDTSELEPGEYVLRGTVSHRDFKHKTRHALFIVN